MPSPINQTIQVNGANATVPNFTATALSTWSVSGLITPASSGSGATLTLTQGATTIGTAFADGTGAYSFGNLSNGNLFGDSQQDRVYESSKRKKSMRDELD